jgi:uncharacterized caspase-like protein
VALCLGISRYQNAAPLPSAVRDAALMGRRFRALGFHTDVVRDASQREVLVALARWRLRAKGAGIAVIYVAAHGVLSGGQTRFFPADAAVQMAEAGLPEHLLIRAVSDVPRHKVLFLDCCRGGDFGGAALPAVALPAGVHITYAAQPQAPAYDGEQYNSPFAQALDQALARPGQSLEQVARQTRLSVLRNTGGAQVPWSRSSLLLPLVLNNGGITN